MAYGTLKADGIEDSNGGTFDLTAAVTAEATTSAKGYMSAADKTKVDGLATVATSGSYNDLTNKPTSSGAFAETGTWTPEMKHVYFSGGNYLLDDMYSHTYAIQSGKYVRVGKMVTVSFQLAQPGTIVYASGNGQSSNFPDFLGNLPYSIQNGWKSAVQIADYSGFTDLGEFTSYGNTYGPYLPVFKTHNTCDAFEIARVQAGAAGTVSTSSQYGFGNASASVVGSITYMTDDTTETPSNGATAD